MPICNMTIGQLYITEMKLDSFTSQLFGNFLLRQEKWFIQSDMTPAVRVINYKPWVKCQNYNTHIHAHTHTHSSRMRTHTHTYVDWRLYCLCIFGIWHRRAAEDTVTDSFVTLLNSYLHVTRVTQGGLSLVTCLYKCHTNRTCTAQ